MSWKPGVRHTWTTYALRGARPRNPMHNPRRRRTVSHRTHVTPARRRVAPPGRHDPPVVTDPITIPHERLPCQAQAGNKKAARGAGAVRRSTPQRTALDAWAGSPCATPPRGHQHVDARDSCTLFRAIGGLIGLFVVRTRRWGGERSRATGGAGGSNANKRSIFKRFNTSPRISLGILTA